MADELYGIQTFLWARLAGDDDLVALLPTHNGQPAIFIGSAPAKAPFPCVIIRYISPLSEGGTVGVLRNRGGDLQTMDGIIIQTRAWYRVFAAIDARNYAVLSPIVKRLKVLLHKSDGDGDDGDTSIISCLRKGPYQRGYFDEKVSKDFSEAGADWDITARAA